MEDLLDLIATDQPAADISDKIKEILYTKASERVDYLRPAVASIIFDGETEQNTQEEE
jgi:hypothetical protein